MSELVTGEAVVLGLRAAKLPSRALAIAMDLIAELIALMVTVLALAAAAPGLDSAAAAATYLGLTVFYLVVVPVLVETLSRGQSLGKLALGLRVVRTDGGPVRFRHSLVRGLVGFVEILVLSGVPAVISSLVSADGRRLGDVFAGTLVVRERVPGAGRGRAALPALPPQLMQALGGELVSLDLSAVPDGLWLAIRQYLGRLDQLDPAVAQGMAHRLVGDVVAHTGHPAPYGLHPAAYLGAVLTERQRREWGRAVAAQQAAAYQAHQHAAQQAAAAQQAYQAHQAASASEGPAYQPAQQGVQEHPQAPAPVAQPPAAAPTGFAPPA